METKIKKISHRNRLGVYSMPIVHFAFLFNILNAQYNEKDRLFRAKLMAEHKTNGKHNNQK